jgi:5S rRNA maturation endonuclease (ribonuclease M5)
MKDLMLLHEFGFISISPTSENILISEHKWNKIKTLYNNVLVFFDNDLAGVRGAKKYKKEYGARCIFIKRKYTKDISDLYKKVSPSVFWTIVDELNFILSDKTVKKTKHFYVF